jgi:hypothetical protein
VAFLPPLSTTKQIIHLPTLPVTGRVLYIPYVLQHIFVFNRGNSEWHKGGLFTSGARE